MQELSELGRTRLVVLGACSTAGGTSVGPQGLAPLVRPLIAANVPAVVGTLWNVKDNATTTELLVSFHCHYRHGDDVAQALRQAQLEMLRKQEPATTWAAFQVVGYAESPWPHPTPLENTHSEHVCTQDSLHRPDGLHHE
jgi:CHAT domain-containing protein